jgi:hypothetical protein
VAEPLGDGARRGGDSATYGDAAAIAVGTLWAVKTSVASRARRGSVASARRGAGRRRATKPGCTNHGPTKRIAARGAEAARPASTARGSARGSPRSRAARAARSTRLAHAVVGHRASVSAIHGAQFRMPT